VLCRVGRNDEAQTTKGWPDAYVRTAKGIVDGVEATRQKQSWEDHLREDLANAADQKHDRLSGYFFVSGYPEHNPARKEVNAWIDRFAALLQKKCARVLSTRSVSLKLSTKAK
jgi:hypothetical protein